MAASKKSSRSRSSKSSGKRSSAKRSGSKRRSASSRSHTRTASKKRSTSAKKRSSSSSGSKSSSRRKYGPKAQKKVAKVMHEFKHGDLKSGGRRKVKSRKQAIAIGISEARREGDKVPSRK